MKIAIIGATGNAGTRLVAEALRRGHEVTAIARHPQKLTALPKVIPRTGDVNEPDGLARLITGHAAAITSVRLQSLNSRTVIAAARQAKLKPLLVVGGAGSLEVAPGVQLVDTPEFPAAYKAEALAARDCLNAQRSEENLEWTFLSPSAEFAPGERTGKFRIGKDRLLTLPDGESKISMEDFAIGMPDELEHAQHIRERFTVGY